jgi:hypothetical protein
MYFPRSWEFGSALSKPRNFGGGGGGVVETPHPHPLLCYWSKKSTLLGLHDPEGEGSTVIQNMVTIYQLTWCNIAEVLILGEAQQ